MKKHTVEKIGGTSMSRFQELLENIIIGKRKKSDLYNRIFVVSAYSGITNLLLEDKKTGAPGVFANFANKKDWEQSLEKVKLKMFEYNKSFEKIGLNLELADEFVNERIAGVKASLEDLMRLSSFGHFKAEDYLPVSREFLSAIGEAHSAFNSALIVSANGIHGHFLDLTGWKNSDIDSLDETIKKGFKNVDYSKELVFATGYVKCEEGLMTRYDRGYSEITFSKIAVLTKAFEGIIHKEYHLSTGDPLLIGVNDVNIIGKTNFDIADQLSDMDMEAIHSKASKDMELSNIPIRIKNAFDPEHPGTLISKDYIAPSPRVEMICGRDDVVAIEVFDPEMVGQSGYDYNLLEHFKNAKTSYIAKNTNANTITHFISEKNKNITKIKKDISKAFPTSIISIKKVAIVSVIGSNMKIPGFLYRAAKALAESEINILALDQCMRQVNMQFILDRKVFEKAQCVLHKEFVK